MSSTCNVGPPQDSDPEDDVSHIDNDPDLIGFSELIDKIIESEESDEPTPGDEADAQTGHSESTLNSLLEGLFAKVQACVDCLVMLAPQLISNKLATWLNATCQFDPALMAENSITRYRRDHSSIGVMLQA